MTAACNRRRPPATTSRPSTATMQLASTTSLLGLLLISMSSCCCAFIPSQNAILNTHHVSNDAMAVLIRSHRSQTARTARKRSNNARTINVSARSSNGLVAASTVLVTESPLFTERGAAAVATRRRMSTKWNNASLLLMPALVFQTLRYALLSPLPALAKSSTAAATATSTATVTPVASVATAATAATLALLKRLRTNLLQLPTTLTTNPKSLIRPALISIGIIVAVASLVDVIGTRRRQSVDATSEWGRYADDPAARGRALMTLCCRIAPYLMVAKMLKLLSGGVTKKKVSTKKRDVVDTAISEEKEEEDDSNKTWALKKASQLRTSSGKLFADGLLRLGPLYIKMGQILSCRENILPEEWVKPMEVLQDRVPAKSGQDALDLVHEAMPGGKAQFDATFSEFNDVPLAAASLGQVHSAKLRDTDESVAIKVQRARLRDIYDKDLALMHKIASAVDRFGGKGGNVGGVEQSWSEIFNDAEVILYREIDYRDEAENAARFAEDFGLGKGGEAIKPTAVAMDGEALPSASSWLRTPYTYRNLSSEKILVMEFVPSIKISDGTTLAASGITAEDKEDLAESLARSYLRQFCANQFFSTDPHAGNLGVEIVNNNESSPRLVFYDFGQACSLSKDQAGGILDVIEGISDMDAKACVTAFDRMGVLKDGADLDKVQRKVQNNFDTGKVSVKKKKAKARARARRSPSKRRMIVPVTEVEKVNGANATVANTNTTTPSMATTSSTGISTKKKDKEGDLEVMAFFTLPAEYAFVARAISQMDGVGKGLDPEFDFISASAPHIVEVKGATTYLTDEAKKIAAAIEKEGTAFQAKIFERFGWNPSGEKRKE